MRLTSAKSRIVSLSVAYMVACCCLFMCRRSSAVGTLEDSLNPIREHDFTSSLKIKVHVVQMRRVGAKVVGVAVILRTPGTVTIPQCAEISHEFLGLDVSDAPEYKKVVDAYHIKRLKLQSISDAVLAKAAEVGLFDGLEYLNIRCSKITSLAPLASSNNFDALRTLVVASCHQLTDIAAIGRYHNLQTLQLERTAVRDIGSLRTLENLITLRVSEAPIADVSPLSKMRRLSELQLFGTGIQDITPLASLEDLRLLYLGGTDVRNIQALRSLKKLTSLSLGPGTVEDTMPLACLCELRKLYLGATDVNDLAPLAQLQNLEHLSLDAASTSEPDFSPLFRLKKLREIQYTGELDPKTIWALKEHLPQCRVETWSD